MYHSKTKITFLGTGTSSGVPMIGCDCNVCNSSNSKDNRLRSSILIQTDTTSVVIDTTPDFRYQMLRSHNKKLDAVVFTHAHKDHIAGLDDVRAYNYFGKKSIPLYATTATQEALLREFAYAFSENKYPGVPEVYFETINDSSFKIGDIELLPIKVFHLKMQVLGFRFKNFTYITDANFIADEEKEKIKGSEVLVLNALRKEKHISHFTLQEAIDLGNELQVNQVYFTHISHQLGKHDDINKELPSNMQLAYDGLQLTI